MRDDWVFLRGLGGGKGEGQAKGEKREEEGGGMRMVDDVPFFLYFVFLISGGNWTLGMVIGIGIGIVFLLLVVGTKGAFSFLFLNTKKKKGYFTLKKKTIFPSI